MRISQDLPQQHKLNSRIEVNRAGAPQAALNGALDDDAVQVTIGEQDKQPGVIRNLLAGHYKGVADVRLRINFADRLSALQEQERMSTLRSAADGLRSDVDSALSALSNSLELDPAQLESLKDLQSKFEAAVDSAAAETSPADLQEQLESSAMDIISSVKELLAGNKTLEAGETAEVPAEGEEPVPDPLQAALSGLEKSITESLQLALAADDQTSLLPPLSSPNGKGAAYAKFLNMYLSGPLDARNT